MFLTKDLWICQLLKIWDTAGQERFKTLRTPFYRGSDICLLTYAVDDRISFRNLTMWRNEFVYYADVKENSHFPFIVVGNKVCLSDLFAIKLLFACCLFLVWCKKWGQRSITTWIGNLVQRKQHYKLYRSICKEF